MSSKARRKLRGRKRKIDAKRFPCGKIDYRDDPVIPHHVLVRRSEITGMDVEDKRLRTVDASSALGRLHIIGLLKDHHRDAGLRLLVADRQWNSAIGAPNRHARVADLGCSPKGPEREPPMWDRARDTFERAKKSVRPGVHWHLVQTIVMEDFVPPYLLTEGENSDRIRRFAIEAFDDLAKYYGLTDRSESA